MTGAAVDNLAHGVTFRAMRRMGDAGKQRPAVDLARRVTTQTLKGRQPAAVALALSETAARHSGAALQGYIEGALDLLDEAHEAGARITCAPGLHPVLALALSLQGDARRAALDCLPADQTPAAIAAVTRAAELLAPWLGAREDAQPTPLPTQPVEVALKVEWPQGPVPVKVLSVPTTVATSEVSRDSSGRIATTTVTTEAKAA